MNEANALTTTLRRLVVRLLSVDEFASTMQFLIFVQAIDHPSNDAGGNGTLTTTVKWGSGGAISFITDVVMLGNSTDFVTVCTSTCSCQSYSRIITRFSY